MERTPQGLSLPVTITPRTGAVAGAVVAEEAEVAGAGAEQVQKMWALLVVVVHYAA